jgi:hypothetical protein
MKRRWLIILLIVVLTLTLLCLLAQLAFSPSPSQASTERSQSTETPAPTGTATPIPGDAYEPDDAPGADPPWIAEGETQDRSFDPEGDLDRARLYVKAGYWYQVETHGLGPLVDTILTVEVSGTVYEDDDSGPEPLASRVLFQAPADGEVLVTITNRQAVYGPAQTYRLAAGEAESPTPTPTVTLTPTATPSPTATPVPTQPPRPTATPPKPIIAFSATPDRLDKPGDCATLRWSVDRASEVFLVLPNGNQEGVEGLGELQVCPIQTSEYRLKVNAPGGDETVRVQIIVPLPTPTPAPTEKPTGGGGTEPEPGGRATLHVAVFVDGNANGLYDPGEGVHGAPVYLRAQENPDKLSMLVTDAEGQVHFEKTPAGAYAVLIPHLGQATTVSFRGEELAINVLVPALRLPSRIP